MEKIILQHGEKCSKNFVLDKKITSLDELMDVLNTSPSLFVRHRPYPSAFIRSWQFHMIKNWLDRGDFWTMKKIGEKKRLPSQGDLYMVTSDFFLINNYSIKDTSNRKVHLKKGEIIEIRFPYAWHFRTEDNLYYHAEEADILNHCKIVGRVMEKVKWENKAKLEEILRLNLYEEVLS